MITRIQHPRSVLAALVATAVLVPNGLAQLVEDEIVVPANSTWEYLLYAPDDGNGVFTPSDPSVVDPDFYTTWQLGGAGYDGPAFASGAAPLGYGDVTGDPFFTNIWDTPDPRDGAIVPPSGSRYSAYFRTTFVPTSDATALRISSIIDDGAIVYLDGVEIARTTNFAAGAADVWDLLTTATGSETGVVTADIGGLTLPAFVPVVISASIHSAAVGSSDMGMNFRVATLLEPDPSPPPNDDFADAEVLDNAVPVTVTGRTHDGSVSRALGATLEGFLEPDHGGVDNVGSIWYSFQPASDGPVQVSVGGSSYEAVLAVYTGTIGAFDEVASAVGEVPFYEGSLVVFNASSAETYYIAVSGESNGGDPVLDENFGDVSLTVDSAPVSLFTEMDTLLPAGSDWLYLLVAEDDAADPLLTNQPVDPALFGAGDPDFHTTWHTATAYDGPAFSGPATALLGYGDIDADPIITDIWGARDIDGDPLTEDLLPPTGLRYAAYFRTTFTPTTDVPHIGFRGLFDDGAVIFINGVEVSRINFLGDVADWQAFSGPATDTETAPQEGLALGVDLAAFVPVEIGVTLRNPNATSSDMGFDMEVYSIVPPVQDFGKVLAGDDPLIAGFDTAASGATQGAGDGGIGDNLPWRVTAGAALDEAGLPNPPADPGNALYVNNGSLSFVSGHVDLEGIDNSLVTAAIDLRIVDTSSGFEAVDTVEAYLEGSNDGIFFTRVATILPLLAGADPDPGPLKRLELPGGAYTTFGSTAGAIPVGLRSVRIVVEGINNSGSEHIFVDNVAIGTSIGPPPPIFVTISRNPATGENQIDWNADDVGLYEISYSVDLAIWNFLDAQVALNTFTHTPPAGDREGFYRVERFDD